jgi:hypothetical protein
MGSVTRAIQDHMRKKELHVALKAGGRSARHRGVTETDTATHLIIKNLMGHPAEIQNQMETAITLISVTDWEIARITTRPKGPIVKDRMMVQGK